MTDATYTHVFFLLDRSGSMQSMKPQTEEGFAAYIKELATASGTCRVSLAQFDNDYESVFHDIDVHDCPPLALQPRGSTALLDSIGHVVVDAGRFLAAKPEDQRPGSVIVAIMTDGMENASHEWTHPAIKALIEEQENVYGWQFMYMGANQDAIETGRWLGLAEEQSLNYSAAGVGAAFQAAAQSANSYRSAMAGGVAPDQARRAAAYTPAQRRAAMGEQESREQS